MALIVKYKFQNVDANGNSVTLLPQFPSGVSYTKTDVVEGNITTRVIETDDLSKVTYIRFGCNTDNYVTGAWEYLTEISDINISYVNTFYRMFRGCKLLNKIDVSNWDTSKVTNMTSTFDNCISLTQLDVSNFDTGKVGSMGYMFNNCPQLTQLDVSKWDTSNVTNMSSVFQHCAKLTQLDVSKWDTGNVTSMGSMFRECSQLTQLDVSKWDTGNVTSMSSMFAYCSQLTQLDVSNFDTSNVTSMAGMFAYCYQLTQLNVSNWDTSKVTNMASMFNSCYQLTQLDVSNWDTSKVTDMGSMFAYCHQLTQLNVSNWDTSKVTNMASMFQNCSQLAQLDLSKWVASKVTNMQSMFQKCSQLTQLDVSNFDTSNVTSMAGMFNSCSQLTQLDVSNFDTSNVTNMYSMFNSCSQLTQLDVSNFDTSKATNMQNMFSSCKVENVGLIYCSKDTIDKLANCITSLCNFYVTNKTYTSPNPLVKYVMYREDKKRILYYNDETQTWEKPILREWDSIEKHSDGKYYYHKRSGEVVLDGSENWAIATHPNIPSVNTTMFMIFHDDMGINVNINTRYSLNDKLIDNTKNLELDAEGLIFASNWWNTRTRLLIRKSVSDVSIFKAWLQANPVTVVYELAEEKVYECTDLDLIIYQNETNLMVESGAIVPKTTLKVHQNIANIATILQEKVSVLENNVGHVNGEIDNINNEIGNINTDLTSLTESIEGSFVSVVSKDGYLKDIEIIGNTIQNQNDLADIRSVGDKVEGQELYEIPVLSCGKNLCIGIENGQYNENGTKQEHSTRSRTSKIIQVLPNSTITISGWTDATTTVFYMSTYDENMKHISRVNVSMPLVGKTTITIPSNAYFVSFTKDACIVADQKVQIEVGDIATEYEPYQEQQITILSPTPLEKVGDVADRIVCKNGVWGVEKNIVTKVLNGSETWARNNNWTSSDYSRFHMSNFDAISGNILKVISDKFVGVLYSDMDNREYEIVSSYNNGLELIIHISNSKLSTVDSQGFKKWLKENPTTVKYQTTQPTFIPLPYDQQVKLRTFANKTNISFGCEIEPTLKASVPKSLSATVNSHSEQIDNLGKELDKVKKLEESVASEVITESDFTTVENTSNGYFEDVKLEGKTLVNMLKTTTYILGVGGLTEEDFTLSNSRNYLKYVKINTNKNPKWLYISCGKLPFDMLKPNTKYTIKLDKCVGVISVDFKRNDGTKAISDMGVFDANGCAVVTTTSELVDADQTLYLNVKSYMASEVEVSNVILLEGDHTQNPPEFFEGLKSVGQDVEEISVLSCNENLFDVKSAIEKYPSQLTSFGNGLRAISVVHNLTYLIPDVNKQYTISWHGELVTQKVSNAYIGFAFVYTDGTSDFVIGVGDKKISSTKGKMIKEFRITYSSTCTMNLTNISLVEGDTPKPYQPAKQDKKPLLYYNPTTDTWEKPVLREWDSIEKRGDKYYYIKRSEEVVLNGSENWVMNNDNNNGIMSAMCDTIGKVNGNVICDKLASSSGADTEGVLLGRTTGKIMACLDIAKLSTQNIQGFKTWLQANPVTVVYQLAQEKVYECTDLDLITFPNETNLLVKSGVLNPKVSLKVSKGVGNVVSMLQNKVTMLEQMVYNLMKMLNNQQRNIDE